MIDHASFVRLEAKKPFTHRDQKRLIKVADAKPNPWMQILAAEYGDINPM